MLGFSKREQERKDFEKQALEFTHPLYGLAMRLTHDPADAEDLVQETYLRAFRFYKRFEPGTKLKAWLFRIETNLFINKYRRKVKEREALDGSEEITLRHYSLSHEAQLNAADPEGLLTHDSLSDEVSQALDQVPVDFRTTVLLADVHEFSYKEIASMTDTPLGTVMSRLYRGRRILQEKLYDYAIQQGILHPLSDGQNGQPANLETYRQRRARGGE